MKKNAFTMLELVITIVILGIISSVGVGIIKFSYDNQKKVETLNTLELKSQAAIDFLTAHLDNSIKNSFRLKNAIETDCKTNSHDCKFVFNIDDEDLGTNYNVLEWARIAILDKRENIWDWITPTGEIDKNNPSVPISTTKAYGIYFLGDNIANTTTFIETDLFKLQNGIISYDKSLKKLIMSNAYVLVDNIEGIVYEKDEKALYFYSEAFDEYLANKDKENIEKVLLVDNVKSITITNFNGVSKIKLCLEVTGLPHSYFSSEASKIEVCKTGVIL